MNSLTPVSPEEFGRRLIALLESCGIDRHGAGAYLSKKYRVAQVTANAWLNGSHRASIKRVAAIASDHGASLDDLYFAGKRHDIDLHVSEASPAYGWPFKHISQQLWNSLTDGQRMKIEGEIMMMMDDMSSPSKREVKPEARRLLQR